ncbi:MAG: hypothetical protein ABI591_03095, partial [Kofleriaceae bacterium]
QATRLDLPPEHEETATVQSDRPQRVPVTPSSVPTRVAPPILPHREPEMITGASSVVESTTTAAQPIVDVLTGVQPLIAKRTTPPPFPSIAHDDSGRRSLGSAPHAVQPHAGTPQVQAGPHGAIVPVRGPQITRADTDAADEATTVEPPLFPMPEPEFEGLPPESVYIPPPRPAPLPMPMLKRWGLVGVVLLIPLVIGLIAHACQGDAKPAAVVHGGP